MKEDIEIAVNFLIAQSGERSTNNFHYYYKELNSFVEWDKVLSIGRENICRFCGETNRSQFKKNNAHSFPEFTGNKWLFSKDECKKCNSVFGIYENEFANHGLLMRTLNGLKTKKRSSTTYKNEMFRFQKNDTVYNINFTKSNDSKSRVGLGNLTLKADFIAGTNSAKVILPQKKYIPLYLFKALAKIAMSIMPIDELEKNCFKDFSEWLIDINSGIRSESYQHKFYIYHNELPLGNRKPLLKLYKKDSKFESEKIPTYSLVFIYGSHLFQIYLPFIKADNHFIDDNEFRIHIIPEIGPVKDKKLEFKVINGSVSSKIQGKEHEINLINKLTW